MFPTTHWSEIQKAADEPDDGPRPELAKLVVRYTPALRKCAGRFPEARRDDIDDILQSFFTEKVLRTPILENAERSKGRFRSYISLALRRHFIQELRALNAQKRGGGRPTEEADADLVAAVDDQVDTFDSEWAGGVMQDTLECMRKECESTGRIELWNLFQSRILNPAQTGCDPLSYDEICSQFKFDTPRQAANALITTKRMFERHLRTVIGRYEGSPDDIDQEIKDFKRIFSRAAQSSRLNHEL